MAPALVRAHTSWLCEDYCIIHVEQAHRCGGARITAEDLLQECGGSISADHSGREFRTFKGRTNRGPARRRFLLSLRSAGSGVDWGAGLRCGGRCNACTEASRAGQRAPCWNCATTTEFSLICWAEYIAHLDAGVDCCSAGAWRRMRGRCWNDDSCFPTPIEAGIQSTCEAASAAIAWPGVSSESALAS